MLAGRVSKSCCCCFIVPLQHGSNNNSTLQLVVFAGPPTLGKYWLSAVPTMTGASTSCSTLTNIALASTGTRVPTRREVRSGVVNTAISVDAVVIMMLSGMSPFAM